MWLSSSYLGGEKATIDMDTASYSKSELTEMAKSCFQLSGEAVAALTALQLEEKVSFFAGPMSKRQILMLR